MRIHIIEVDFRSFVREAVEQATEKALEESLKKGRLEGLAEGEQKGRIEGEQKGRREGEAQGELRGRKLGLVEQVRVFQSLLREPVSAESDLLAMELGPLSRLCDELKGRLTLRQ